MSHSLTSDLRVIKLRLVKLIHHNFFPGLSCYCVCVCVRCSSPSLWSISFSAHISTHRWEEDKHVCICTFFFLSAINLWCSAVLLLHCGWNCLNAAPEAGQPRGTALLQPVNSYSSQSCCLEVCVCADPAESCFGSASAASSGLSGFVPGRSCSDRPTWWSLGLFSQQLLQPYLQLNLYAPLFSLQLSGLSVWFNHLQLFCPPCHKEPFKHNRVCLFYKLKPSVRLLLWINVFVFD